MTKPLAEMPVGVVLRRSPGATRWRRWSWRVSAVLPGAAPADWRLLREDGDAAEFHAATLPLQLFRADTEAYLVSLSMTPPTIFVILRLAEDGSHDYAPHAVTASAYEAQDYQDGGDEVVEPVAAPDGLVAWIRDFCAAHHVEETFVKRQRDKRRVDLVEDGIGDPRVRQTADVYRAPGAAKR